MTDFVALCILGDSYLLYVYLETPTQHDCMMSGWQNETKLYTSDL